MCEYIGQTHHITGETQAETFEYLSATNIIPTLGDLLITQDSIAVYGGKGNQLQWMLYDTPSIEVLSTKSSPELIKLTCQCCGAPVIRKDNHIYTCEYCGTTYLGI